MKKFKTSVTDSGNSITYDEKEKKGISNLIDIYASINNISLEEVEKIFENSQYGEFKIAVGEAVSNYFAPIYSNFQELENEDISKVLESNLKEAQISAEETINEVNNILGL